MVREKIISLIGEAIKNAQAKGKFPKFEVLEILVEKPEQAEQGDYSTNVAMKIAGIAKKNPMEIAEIIVEQLSAENSKFLERIEIAKPGFIIANSLKELKSQSPDLSISFFLKSICRSKLN
jgi:arginyl-tRNA synthetase